MQPCRSTCAPAIVGVASSSTGGANARGQHHRPWGSPSLFSTTAPLHDGDRGLRKSPVSRAGGAIRQGGNVAGNPSRALMSHLGVFSYDVRIVTPVRLKGWSSIARGGAQRARRIVRSGPPSAENGPHRLCPASHASNHPFAASLTWMLEIGLAPPSGERGTVGPRSIPGAAGPPEQQLRCLKTVSYSLLPVRKQGCRGLVLLLGTASA
jgi:hypothetical protein